jgi:hypothetical protein
MNALFGSIIPNMEIVGMNALKQERILSPLLAVFLIIALS